MPQPQASEPHTLSPAEMVLEMIQNIGRGSMNHKDEINELTEIGMERISFKSPEQALEIIAALGHIISSSADPGVRLAALKLMNRMIELEVKAEEQHAPGAPKMDRKVADLLLDRARKETESGVAMAVSPRDPEIGASPVPSPASESMAPPAQPDTAPTEPVAAKRPHPPGLKAEKGMSSAAVMRLLRSIAGAHGEDEMRETASRMIKTIEKQVAQISPSMTAPALTEG